MKHDRRKRRDLVIAEIQRIQRVHSDEGVPMNRYDRVSLKIQAGDLGHIAESVRGQFLEDTTVQLQRT